jgi:hypothetical protein
MGMRSVTAVFIATFALAQAAAAASVNPRACVLRANDVPVSYLVDKDNSTDLPKELLGTDGDARRLLTRAGYVSGYRARYTDSARDRWRYISSSAFVFRTATGARIFLAWLDKSIGRSSSTSLARSAIGLGEGGASYVSASREVGTSIAWRNGRVVAFVQCQQQTGHQSLARALARKQQRRITNALH